jgi:NHL repeat-containing protein
VATSPAGLLIADTGNAVVRRVEVDGTITTVAGALRAAPASGGWVRVPLRSPHGVAATSAGDVVVADGGRIWLVGTDGAARVLAGAARPGFDGDGSDPLTTRLSGVAGLATAPGDAVIAADAGNDRIRSVSRPGTLTTVAGSDRPDVRLAPVALAPFRRARPRTRPIGRPYYHGGGGGIAGGGEYSGPAVRPAPAPSRAPSCVQPGIRANVLKLRPYSRPSIRSAAAPVLLELGTSIDVHLTGFAVRGGRDFGRVEIEAPAGVRTIRLRGRLEPGRYWAVVLGRADDGTRACDARRLRVTAR